METTEQAAWDERYSGPGLVWGAGPNRFVTEEVTALPAGRAIDLGTGEGATRSGSRNAAGRSRPWTFSAAGLARADRLAAERLYTPATVAAELDGLAVTRAEQVMRPVRTPEGERTAIDTLVRAERPA